MTNEVFTSNLSLFNAAKVGLVITAILKSQMATIHNFQKIKIVCF